jgi:hypothetical protein
MKSAIKGIARKQNIDYSYANSFYKKDPDIF